MYIHTHTHTHIHTCAHTHTPHSQELGPLARCGTGGVDEQALDVGDGTDGGPHHPGKTQKGMEEDEDTHDHEIKMVAGSFLEGQRQSTPSI